MLVTTVYAEVQRLAARDSSLVGIARQLSASHGLSISPGTIRHWVVGDRKLQRRNIFEGRPSPAFSYIIGANIGDGCTLTKGWFVKLEVTDLDFARAFNTSMARLFSRSSPNKILVRHRPNRLPMYIVKYSSKQLANLLRLPLKKLIELASAFPQEFLRGFFDAEGHVDVKISRWLGLSVGAENSDMRVLLQVKRLLKRLGIAAGIDRKRRAGSVKVIRGEAFVMRRTSYSIIVGKRVDVRKFAETIGFSIHRKSQKLLDALSIVATYGPRSRAPTWEHLYSKIGGEWVKREHELLR